jgi:hypothetical protein
VAGRGAAVEGDVDVIMGNGLFTRAGMLIAITAVLGGVASTRFRHAGAWLPSVPNTIGYWEGADNPPPAEMLHLLGDPLALQKDYSNPFSDVFREEVVHASVVAAGPFENYHDPTVCVTGSGFVLTAKKVFPLDGPGSGNVRAMIFKKTINKSDGTSVDARILMYYWQQNRNGSTDTEARMGNYRDWEARLNTGFGAVVLGHQTCLMRIYQLIGPRDRNGEQAQRNVHEISVALYRALKESGKQE